jgi:3-oxoadipate enol-lactonase
MSYLELDGLCTHYRFDGPEDGPVLVLSNSLGTDLSIWEPQVPVLTRHVRLLRYDTRGHGLSGAPPGPYSIEQLGGDVLGLLDGLGLSRVSFCGLSLGGVIGMWLGVNAPERLNKLILCNTGAKIGTPEIWNGRIDQIRKGGMAAVIDATLERWLTPAFRAAAPDRVEWVRQMVLRIAPAGYIANCEALRDADLRDAISSIRTPSMVVTGSKDPATPAELGRFLAERIPGAKPGAKYVELESAHLSNIEAAEKFNDAVVSFLAAR